ncbi:HAMP domain-containing protein [Lachnospiraceae bacterium OM02-31]|nr:HAMP domain-containing protein [Lachnospiraceae bacterium OM02-31]RJW56412.1 HAMP domain-containing protein [Lachnospiraceae bacterium OM02-3]
MNIQEGDKKKNGREWRLKMRHNKKEKTIRSQILKGYLLLTGMMVVLVALSCLFFELIAANYGKASAFQNQQYEAQKVIAAHYQWLEQLSDSITTGSEFEGSLNPDTCALGKWIDNSAADLEDYPELAAVIEEINKPHDEIHSEAAKLVELAKTNRDEAYEQYAGVFKPKVINIGKGLNKISDIYQEKAEQIIKETRQGVLVSVLILLAIGLGASLASVILGRRMATRISKPILAVANWSEQLSAGVDNLRFDAEDLQERGNASEINRMISSFREMADNIREHVRVIQKVAEGDLTAYVDIRSEGDSLGSGLYHMVQNNDFMFARLLEIADTVADNANQIADSAQMLAESSTSQAGAVEQLSDTVQNADTLAAGNAENASGVMSLIKGMNHEILEGQDKMEELLEAVQGIERASENISVVMKSINDIAFQTNILALNAAVEAARAGSAGKGFAVVADEVRNLALKSQEAAEQSRALIENTITKAAKGGNISQQASETFQSIVDRIKQIEERIGSIDDASARQQELMRRINEEIGRISSAVTENAATSEHTAASTQQMNAGAAQIKLAMDRFQLRKREPGKPYIPPEKADDKEFIELATRNFYAHAQKRD